MEGRNFFQKATENNFLSNFYNSNLLILNKRQVDFMEISICQSMEQVWRKEIFSKKQQKTIFLSNFYNSNLY